MVQSPGAPRGVTVGFPNLSNTIAMTFPIGELRIQLAARERPFKRVQPQGAERVVWPNARQELSEVSQRLTNSLGTPTNLSNTIATVPAMCVKLASN